MRRSSLTLSLCLVFGCGVEVIEQQSPTPTPLKTLEREPEQVYCCVRRYESWLPSALTRSGFNVCASQAVMVRHTVHYLPRAVPEVAVALDGQRIPVSSPMIRQFKEE